MISQLHATNAVWKARAGDMELDRRVLMARIQTLEEDSQTEIRKLSALQDEDNQKKIAAAVQDAKAQRDAVEEEARGLRLVVEVLEEERKQALERDRRLDEQQAVMRMITGRDTSPARPQVGRTDYNLPTLVDGAHAADTFPYVKHAHAGIEVDTEQQPGVTVTAELCIPSPGLSSFTKLGREIGRVSPTLMPVSKQLSLLAEPTCTTGQENSEKRETWERRQRAMKRCEFETLKNQLGRVLARRLVVSSMRKSFAQWCRFFSVTTVSTFAVREAKAHMKTQVDRLKQELNASREELQHYVSRFNTPRDEYARRVEVTGNVEMLSLHDCLERSGILERTEAKQTESDVSKEHTPESAEVVSRSTPATLLELGSNEDDTTCRSLTDQDPFGRVAETILPPFLLPRLDSSTLGQHQAKPAERPVNDKEASRHSSNLLLDNSVRSGDVGDHVRVKIVELEAQLAEARQVIHQLQQERSSTPSGSPQAGTPKELLEDHAWQLTADQSHSNATQIDSEMQRAEFGMAVDAHLAPRRSARTIEPKQHQNSKSPDSTRSASPFAKRSQDGLRGEEHEAANHALQDTKEELRVAHKRNEELAHLLQEKEESITLLKQRLQLQALSSLATPPKAGTGVEDVGLLGMESMHAHVDLMQDELASLQAEVDLCNAKSFQKVDNALQRLKDHQCGNSRENVRDIGRPVSANTDQAWHIECAPIDLPALVPRHPDAMVNLISLNCAVYVLMRGCSESV